MAICFFVSLALFRYYAFDDTFVREVLGKKLSKGTKKDLDDISAKTSVTLKSCRRQVCSFTVHCKDWYFKAPAVCYWMVGYSWVLKQTSNHARAPVVCRLQQLIWFYSSGYILLVVVGFLIVEQILSVLVNLLHCVCNFSSTTSNVFSKLSKSWRDPWWRTYVSIFFCLTNLQGNQRQAQSTSLLPQACVLQQLYNLKSVML